MQKYTVYYETFPSFSCRLSGLPIPAVPSAAFCTCKPSGIATRHLSVHNSLPHPAPWSGASTPASPFQQALSSHSFESPGSLDRRWQRPYCPRVSRRAIISKPLFAVLLSVEFSPGQRVCPTAYRVPLRCITGTCYRGGAGMEMGKSQRQ